MSGAQRMCIGVFDVVYTIVIDVVDHGTCQTSIVLASLSSAQYSINLSFLPTSLLCTTFSLGLSPAFSLAFRACMSIPASKKPSVKRVVLAR